jgi:hypothetical protein
MAGKNNSRKTTRSSEEKSIRLQRIVFVAFSIIIVLTMVLGLMTN